ncbi:5'/3'-nucleotidase SurE [bacterium]|nr:5'/3'-nucleotidase SurE [bacterium]
MHILVTNDDGVTAPGLLALTQALRKTADRVTVLAPDRNWSASGHVKTMHRPLRVSRVTLADGSEAWASDGAPSDCVALAVMGFIPEKIDLVVSGINPNANIGHDVTYSGTVTAAMEAAIQGLPGIAVSLERPENISGGMDFGPAAEAARQVAAWLMAQDKLPEEVILNVNVPYGPLAALKGFRLTRQGLRVYRDELVRRQDPHGQPYFWIGGDMPTGVNEPGTDFGAVSSGYVSITPLQLDLTNQMLLNWLENAGAEKALPI